MSTVSRTIDFGGKPLTIEIGKFAPAANGSCTVRYGDTVVLATAVCSKEKRAGLDFFPLMVDFEEKLYAAGRIKGSRFIKREGRPTDEAVLVARFIDRAIRPLFDQRITNDVQVIITTLAFDGINDADVPGLIAASCALHISDIPWNGPIAAARVNRMDGQYILNGSYAERGLSRFDVEVAGTPEKVIMLEAGCDQAPDEQVLEAILFGQAALKPVVDLINELRQEVGKQKLDLVSPKTDSDKALVERAALARTAAEAYIRTQIQELFFGAPKASKIERAEAKTELKKRAVAFLSDNGFADDAKTFAGALCSELLDSEVTRLILEEKRRVDGRGIHDIRPLTSEVGLLPCVHGTGYFTRGETNVLSVCTLGAPGDKQTLDGMELVGEKTFMHHYNFPPFSVGEAKPLRGAGRREIGHGALAEKALMYVVPEKETFPYAIRVVSEVLGSNGSSSMGSTCGASLALMDAGVPIKAPVAGIAMGVASDGKGNFQVITDLQDLEDGNGGMDFKITGTRTGVTAIQLDTKTDGLPRFVIEETIARSKEARMKVLDVMATAIAEPRADLSPNAPRILTLNISVDKIREVIGPGGKMINEIIEKTGVNSIDIEQTGLVMITATNGEAGKKAFDWIHNLTREVQVGEIFDGEVVRLMDFGAFVQVLPGKDGMVHVSELAPWRVGKVSDMVKVGDKVKVKVIEIDEKGRINLSMKQAPGNTYTDEMKARSQESRPSAPKTFAPKSE
ncbi:polyribonucleotide nucleotidyltransferase [Patescibacteria group bacterium]|nr:polyribonucleotide nucleotidyltransferase [Patescibacteria group bacterium]